MDGHQYDSPDDIKEEAVKFFKQIFRESHSLRPTFDSLDFHQLDSDQYSSLSEPFSPNEIKEVYSCDGSKSLGPDGFNSKFGKSS